MKNTIGNSSGGDNDSEHHAKPTRSIYFRADLFTVLILTFAAPSGLTGCTPTFDGAVDASQASLILESNDLSGCIAFEDPDERSMAAQAAKHAKWVMTEVFNLESSPTVALKDVKWTGATCVSSQVLNWSFEAAQLQLDYQIASTLPHELGHLVLFELHNVSSSEQYGSDAPDWIDEAFAIAFEGYGPAKERFDNSVRLASAHLLPPLATFLDMPHPQARALLSSPLTEGPAALDIDPKTGMATAAFYAQSLLFHEYLVTSTGQMDILLKIAADVRSGSSSAQAVKAALAGKGQDSLEDVEASFIAWYENEPRMALPRYPASERTKNP